MIEFQVLGPPILRISEDERDGPVLSRGKRYALLAYLAARSPAVLCSRDKVLALFWPEYDRHRARKALNQAVYHLRRSLGPDVVVTRERGEELGVDAERLWCDAVAFRAALDRGEPEAALELYGGDFLEGFHLSGCPGFGRWVEGQRREFRERALGAARELAEAAGASGEAREAVRWWRRAAELAPYAEPVQRGLLEALVVSGDPAGAMRAYEAFAERLRADLELEPSAELEELAAELRNGEEILPGRRREVAPGVSSDGSSADVDPPAGEDPSRTTAPVAAEGEGEAAPTMSPAQTEAGERTSAPLLPAWLSRLLRRPVALGTVVLVLGAVIALGVVGGGPKTSGGEFVDDRVLVVPFENRTGESELDLIGRIVADWISQELARTDLVEVVPSGLALWKLRDSGVGEGKPGHRDLARETRAGILVSGFYYLRGDSLGIDARITDGATGELLRALDEVTAPRATPLEAAEAVRNRTAGALATVADPRLSSWADAASQPPSFEAYRMYVDGLQLYAAGNPEEAGRRFLRVAERDSSFTSPLVWAMFAYVDRNRVRDSIARSLQPRRHLLAPWDRALLDYHAASARGRREDAYRAIRRIVTLAPAPEWRLLAAGEAMRLNRLNESLELLEAFDPGAVDRSRTWYTSQGSYGRILTSVLHRLGKYERELRAVGRHLPRAADRLSFVELRALAGLGRDREVLRHVDDLLGAGEWDTGLAHRLLGIAEELRAHGREETARALLDRLIARFRAAPTRVRRDGAARLEYGRILYATGRWKDAREVFSALLDEGFKPMVVRGDVGLVAARLGDREEAERISDWYAARGAEGAPYTGGWHTYKRALIAAALGDSRRAVRLLEQAYDRGWSHGIWEHRTVEFEALSGNPRFEALMRPRD